MEPAPHPSAAELDVAQLTIMGLATVMTLLSVAVFVEEAFYLTRKIRCPIKMKTLRWSSSAPTVSWGAGASPQGDSATRGVPAPVRGGTAACQACVSSPGCVRGQLLRALDPTCHDGGGDGYHDVSIT